MFCIYKNKSKNAVNKFKLNQKVYCKTNKEHGKILCFVELNDYKVVVMLDSGIIDTYTAEGKMHKEDKNISLIHPLKDKINKLLRIWINIKLVKGYIAQNLNDMATRDGRYIITNEINLINY